ncbi:MAG: type I DNA topoisomerase [Bacteroidota bacterium]|nr:type I DNA topoisomerase [Bacteroidota bacterium]
MAKNLVIVESPAKAKTIEGYLGKDFVVKSSMGHIRDLAKGNDSVDIDNDFTPKYVVSPSSKNVVTELKSLANKADTVWLATDEDREGEAISWHLMEALGLKEEQTKRIVFSEITKPAILKAIESPRTVDADLVNAQQARRILDRLVGFELSPVLWRKIRPSLSAGRVQSVGVRIIVDREREIDAHTAKSTFRVVGHFDTGNAVVKATCGKTFNSEAEAQDFLESCAGAEHVVTSIETKPATKKPAAPFTTSTLQQEASRKLSFSVSRTMGVAQRLYEAGRITYMRTDSTNLSDVALEAAEKKIGNTFGSEYAFKRTYASKSKGAQEAHEAIRPTDLSLDKIDASREEQRLYELIYKRTLASQMADAKIDKTVAKISVSGREETFVARGEVITFEGFLKLYLEGTDDEEGPDETTKDMLPAMTEGQAMSRQTIVATQRFSKHPPRYTEASLVKRLEELGIGRPSTYASTIDVMQKRGYVVKEDRDGTPRDYRILTLSGPTVQAETASENAGQERSKLFPTDIGLVVNDFLLEHFQNILDYNFTADVEGEFDVIAQGQLDWRAMLKRFYSPFKETVDTTMKHAERASGERILGVHPESGAQILCRIGRYGPMAQIGGPDDEEKQYASLLPGQSIETLTLEEALDLFKLPRTLGELEGKKVTAAIGRFGPYVRYDGKFVSLKADDGDDPYTVTLERAVELIQAKIEADAKALIKVFEEDETVRVLNGRYGPYIKAGKTNAKIPKDEKPEDLTWDRVQELIEEAKNRPKRGRRKKS